MRPDNHLVKLARHLHRADSLERDNFVVIGSANIWLGLLLELVGGALDDDTAVAVGEGKRLALESSAAKVGFLGIVCIAEKSSQLRKRKHG